MCENQMAELDAVLPALRASGEAPFAMMVRGTTYRERAEAAPALLDSLGQAYVEGKRYGNTKEFPIATLRGVEVSASRMLSSDEMIQAQRPGSYPVDSSEGLHRARDSPAGVGASGGEHGRGHRELPG